MGTFARLAFLAAAVVGLRAETLDEILARVREAANGVLEGEERLWPALEARVQIR